MASTAMMLRPKTQSLIKKRMKLGGYAIPESPTAIERGLAQAERIEVKAWHEVRASLRKELKR